MSEMPDRTRQEALADRGGASLRGRSIGRMAGQWQTGRQAGSGMARSRSKARLTFSPHGQRWGRCRVNRRADRVSRDLLARAWKAGAGPGDGPLTIDLDSTICETYGLDKEGARHHGYTGARGYHPLLAVAAGTGDVLMVRLREGRANTARGAAHFLRETVGRVRCGGASGQLTMRADRGFYTHAVAAVCRRMDARFSITIRQHKSLHNLIEAIPADAWTPIPYWMDGAADVAETTCTPFQSTGQPNVPANSRHPVRASLAASSPRHLALPNVRRRP